MRNTILTAMILMLVPGMALAQFYTITKESGTIKVQASNKENSIDNKEDIDKTKSVEIAKDTTLDLSTDSTYLKLYTQKVDGKTSQKSECS